MNIKKLFYVRLVLITFTALTMTQITSPTKVWAANDEVKEVSYDDLVNELARKKSAYKNPTTNPFDNIKIHAGLGLITSANRVSTPNGSGTKSQNGFQLSVGIDLFTADWAAEAALRNFGQAASGSETRTLREFDLKMMNRGPLSNNLGYRWGAGLGTRYLRVQDDASGVSVNDSTPTALFFGGFDVFANKNISLGLEAGLRAALMNTTADKGAADLMVRFDTYF